MTLVKLVASLVWLWNCLHQDSLVSHLPNLDALPYLSWNVLCLFGVCDKILRLHFSETLSAPPKKDF